MMMKSLFSVFQLLILASVVQSPNSTWWYIPSSAVPDRGYNILVCKICFMDVDLIQFG